MKILLLILTLFISSITLHAQQTNKTAADSLLSSLNTDDKPNINVSAFKATRLILSQSTETIKKQNLNFLVIHRFGDLAGSIGGARTLYGLDDINDVYIGFEYGLTDDLNIDFGRSTVEQLIEFGVKYAVFHQKADESSPVALTLVGQYGIRPYGTYTTFDSRVSYLAQAIVSRKISSLFSLQVSPVFVRDNTPLPDVAGNQQQFFALMGTGRIALNKHMGFLIDYSHSFLNFRTGANGFTDPLGFGFEAETGGHVFTLNITNSRSISEITSLSNSQADYGRGQYRLGFTISRVFDFNHSNDHKH